MVLEGKVGNRHQGHGLISLAAKADARFLANRALATVGGDQIAPSQCGCLAAAANVQRYMIVILREANRVGAEPQRGVVESAHLFG